MTNYDSVIRQLSAAGLIVEHLVADGKVRRCKVEGDRERRGWYLLHTWQASNGREYLVGSFGVWRGTDNGAQKIELARDLEPTAEEREAIRARLAEDRKRAKAQRFAESQRAARRAAAVWAKALTAPPDGKPADYLARKGIQSYGLRYSPTGALIVPMMDGRAGVHGLQFILPSHHPRRQKVGRDKEYWPAGLAKTGHWFQIGSPVAGGVLLIAEGYATGATLHAATGLPVAVAFDAGNLQPVAEAAKKTYRTTRILICADDDYLQKCRACGSPTTVALPACGSCGAEHGQVNPGQTAAAAAALAVGGAWVAPVFPGDRNGRKLTDFNDLQAWPNGGLPLVRAQLEAKLQELGWADPSARRAPIEGGGEDDLAVPSMMSIDDAARRYFGIYGMGGKVMFDAVQRRIVHRDDVLNLLPERGWGQLKAHPNWRVVTDTAIGFDPTEADPAVKCNLFGGWPMKPRPGKCKKLLELLEYLCSNEPNGEEIYLWMLQWLAYPLQHPGAKMHSAIVVHGPQGTGKSRFFEAYAKIFGPYGRVLGQEAIEDKFNADWAEKKLFIVADEVLARAEMYHVKNRLKGFITGEWIRVNPKNLAAHNERNQMNIVFLSNERMPLVLENDDRRHLVVWTPQKMPEEWFAEIDAEIDNDGVAALYDYLLHIDTSQFKPWTKPPMTHAKRDLIQQSLSSEDRFFAEWLALEVEGHDGEPLPVCPCLGAHLYQAYERWCSSMGERARRAQELIGMAGKRPGWSSGTTHATWSNLHDRTTKNRRMVVPSDVDMLEATKRCRSGTQQRLDRSKFESKAHWLTAGFFAFQHALGADQ